MTYDIMRLVIHITFDELCLDHGCICD